MKNLHTIYKIKGNIFERVFLLILIYKKYEMIFCLMSYLPVANCV